MPASSIAWGAVTQVPFGNPRCRNTAILKEYVLENALKSKTTITRASLLDIALALVCFFTSVSQHPALVEAGITRYLAIPVWGILTLLVLADHRPTVSASFLHFLKYPALFICLVLLMTLFKGNVYLSSGLFYSLLLSVFCSFGTPPFFRPDLSGYLPSSR